jgi:trehalose synthase
VNPQRSIPAYQTFSVGGDKDGLLAAYRRLIGDHAVEDLQRYGGRFEGRKIVHVNSTFAGGGVAEILQREVLLADTLGIATEWYRIRGDEDFFETTKGFHNALQGKVNVDSAGLIGRYRTFYANGARELNGELIAYLQNLSPRDVVVIHDPQPLHLINFLDTNGPVKLWRIHIDTTCPDRDTMAYVSSEAIRYDGIITTMKQYVTPHLDGLGRVYTLAPSIDAFSDKNRDMDAGEVRRRVAAFGIQTGRDLLVQVSRLDPWKDPVGVIQVFEKVRDSGHDCQLALVFNSADDDPEGMAMETVVRERRRQSPYAADIYLVCGDDPWDVNAFQRYATVVIQKSLREGFGLTVTEALFKEAMVVATDVGGITLQVKDGDSGFTAPGCRVNGDARSVRGNEYEKHLNRFTDKVIRALQAGEKRALFGRRGRQVVVNKFLTTSKLKNLLDIVLACD